MTAALTLRRYDNGEQSLAGQLLLYPEARLPFGTPAAVDNHTGLYLECNGILGYASNYLPRAPLENVPPPSHRYITPGEQDIQHLKGLPPAIVATCGFDPLRDVGVEYASKLQQAGRGHLASLSPFGTRVPADGALE